MKKYSIGIYDLEVSDSDRLYNLRDFAGRYFKLKRVPLKYKFPYYDHASDKWQWKPFYKPLHFWRVSPGDGQDYIGGTTVEDAYHNMVKHYGFEKVNALGKKNAEWLSTLHTVPIFI